MPTPSKRSLRLKRVAQGALREAESTARPAEKWTEDHLRTWQSILRRAVENRTAILRAYLEHRRKRRSTRSCVMVD